MKDESGNQEAAKAISMMKRYVVRAAAQGPFEGEVPAETIRALAKNFPPNAARRMTHLGLLLGETLKEFPIEPNDAVVYATTFGETVATGRYLESFPAASPLFFQTSIHPSAIEQVLINRGCPVRELTPLAGQPDLSAQAALTALLTPGKRVLLTGGEEVGTWLRRLDAASNVGFGFALELGETADGGAVGELSWDGRRSERPATDRPVCPAATGDLHGLFFAVRERRALRCASPAGGEVALTWY